jgi:hypothetical protein
MRCGIAQCSDLIRAAKPPLLTGLVLDLGIGPGRWSSLMNLTIAVGDPRHATLATNAERSGAAWRRFVFQSLSSS